MATQIERDDLRQEMTDLQDYAAENGRIMRRVIQTRGSVAAKNVLAEMMAAAD